MLSKDLKKLVYSLGYKNFFSIQNSKKLEPTLSKFLKQKGPIFLEVKINSDTLQNLIRPKNLKLIKKEFVK